VCRTADEICNADTVDLVAVSKAEGCRTDWSPAEYGVMKEAKCLILRYVPFRIAFAQIFGILLSGSGVCLQPYSMSLGGNISNN
jgi:hypothetical protein